MEILCHIPRLEAIYKKICKKFSIIFYNSLKSDIVDEINLHKLDSAEKGNAR